MAAPLYDSIANYNNALGSAWSWTHTPGAGTSDGVGLVWLYPRSAGGIYAPTTVTWGGQACTLLTSQANDGSGLNGTVYLYYIVNPPAGAAAIACNAGWTYEGSASSLVYGPTDVLSPFGTPVGGTSSVAVTAQPDWIVVDGIQSITDPAPTLTVGAGQTERANFAGARMSCHGSSEEAGAASVTMSWTPSGGHSGMIGVALRPKADPRKRLVAYVDDLDSADRRLVDINGQRLWPWEVRADQWVRYAGWAPPSSVVYDSLVDDPTCGYIEDVSWDSDSDVATTTTSRMDLGEIIIARASAQSNG